MGGELSEVCKPSQSQSGASFDALAQSAKIWILRIKIPLNAVMRSEMRVANPDSYC